MAWVVQADADTVIQIQLFKTKLFQSEVEYLGHKISKGGVSMIPEYEQKIKDLPVPKSGMEVATFLGFTGYYCTFIPQYSELTNWLNRIKKAKKLLWNKEIEQDLIELKKAFTNWSKENIPGVLSQVQDGQERFLRCWGRKCDSMREIILVTKQNC